MSALKDQLHPSHGSLAGFGGRDWFVVKDSNGAIGLVRGLTSNVVSFVRLGAASLNVDTIQGQPDFGRNLDDALAHVGATDAQQTSLIGAIDRATGSGDGPNTNWIYVSPHATPGANNVVSSNNPGATKPQSEAVATNLIPGLGGLSGLFGNVDLWKGIGLILAGAAILVFAALELKRL